MNFKEGMRRVGIVLGLLGGITGGVFGYSELQNAWGLHTRFKRLQALPVMHDVATAIKAYREFTNIKPSQGQIDLPAGLVPKDSKTAASQTNWLAANAPKTAGQLEHGPWELDYDHSPAGWYAIDPRTGERVYGFEARKSDVSDKMADPDAEITVDAKSLDGIKVVNADKNRAISSIELTTGERISREPDTFKAYLALAAPLILPFCYPVIGFLVPWGTIRALVWVGSGFFAPPTAEPRQPEGQPVDAFGRDFKV
jgi:hypothetical protein